MADDDGEQFHFDPVTYLDMIRSEVPWYDAFQDSVAAATADVAVGRRTSRSDPASSSAASNAYWALYRRFVMPAIPAGGVDVFAVTRPVAQTLLKLREAHSSLVGQLFWVGYRRTDPTGQLIDTLGDWTDELEAEYDEWQRDRDADLAWAGKAWAE